MKAPAPIKNNFSNSTAANVSKSVVDLVRVNSSPLQSDVVKAPAVLVKVPTVISYPAVVTSKDVIIKTPVEVTPVETAIVKEAPVVENKIVKTVNLNNMQPDQKVDFAPTNGDNILTPQDASIVSQGPALPGFDLTADPNMKYYLGAGVLLLLILLLKK